MTPERGAAPGLATGGERQSNHQGDEPGTEVTPAVVEAEEPDDLLPDVRVIDGKRRFVLEDSSTP